MALKQCETMGDVNYDGYVTNTDATWIQEYIVGIRTFTDEQKIRADVNGDGIINAIDVSLIKQYVNGLITSFPACPTFNISITGTITWSGTTNASGYAKDVNGFSPSLPYGNYNVTASKTGYDSASQDFTVPLVGNINLIITRIYQTVEIIVSD